MKDSSWLLSPEACPKVEIPVSPAEPVRRFRMPSCIGEPPRIEIAAVESQGRFRDRTLAWFSAGEDMEREADEALDFDIDFVDPRRRPRLLWRAAQVAVGVAAIAVVAAWIA